MELILNDLNSEFSICTSSYFLRRNYLVTLKSLMIKNGVSISCAKIPARFYHGGTTCPNGIVGNLCNERCKQSAKTLVTPGTNDSLVTSDRTELSPSLIRQQH